MFAKEFRNSYKKISNIKRYNYIQKVRLSTKKIEIPKVIYELDNHINVSKPVFHNNKILIKINDQVYVNSKLKGQLCWHIICGLCYEKSCKCLKDKICKKRKTEIEMDSVKVKVDNKKIKKEEPLKEIISIITYEPDIESDDDSSYTNPKIDRDFKEKKIKRTRIITRNALNGLNDLKI